MDKKPSCDLRCIDGSIFSILFRVGDTLRAAGLDDNLNEFLARAVTCCSCGEMIQLAKEYVELEDSFLA